MENHKILIAVPSMSTVPIEFFGSALSIETGGMAKFCIEANSLVYNARNTLAYKAIEGGYDYILWLDSDMIFPRDVLLSLLDDAEKHDLEYVSGLYFSRKMPTAPIICKSLEWHQDQETGKVTHRAVTYDNYPRDRLFIIGGGGFGSTGR